MTIVRGQPALAADVLALVTAPAVASVDAAATLDLQANEIVTLQRWTSTSLFAPALYQKVGSDPGTGLAFQDSSGTWFENIEPVVTPEMFGALGQPEGYAGPNYDDPAWQIAINAQRPIKAMSPTYCFNAAPIVPSKGIFWVTSGLAGIKPAIYGTISHSFAFGFVDYVQWVHIENMCLDGGRARIHGFPYSVNTLDSYTFVAFIDFHADINDPTTGAEILNCVFQNTHVYSWHLTMFHHCRALGNSYVRTADHGFIACVDVVEDDTSTEFCSDNGTSISRGCQRVRVNNFYVKDCELAGFWFAGFNTTGSGTLTITGTYSVLGVVSVVASFASQFDQSDVDTFVTAFGAGATPDSCIIKITAVADGQHATGSVITVVPSDLQATPSTSWQNAPSLGVCDLVATNLIIIGAYANAIDGVTGPKHINIGNAIIRRTGIIADSEVVTTASIAKGASTATCASSTGGSFPAGSWIIFDPPTSYQDYFIAKVSVQSGDALTLVDASGVAVSAPRTYAIEIMRLAHRQTGATGCPINITGSTVGQHNYGEEVDLHDMIISDFVGIGARLGNSGNGSVRGIKLNEIKFLQPGLIQDPTIGTSLIRMEEYRDTVAGVDYPSDDFRFTNIHTDKNVTTAFIKFFQRGTTPRRVVLGPNYVPNVSNYFTAVDQNNSNADCTAGYLTSYQAPLADPVGTSATSPGVMMGLGVFAQLIAQKTGIYDVMISGNAINATLGNQMLIHGRYSSAVGAPANGASAIGTVFCSALSYVTTTAGVKSGFTLFGRCGASGDPQVPIGSTIWVDLTVVSVGATLVSLTDIRITLRELDSDQVAT